jgi:ribonuclease D
MLNNSKNSYITSQSELNDVVALVRKKKLVAIDTEFTRETTYYPILSIIQLAVKSSDENVELFIIDCLSDVDLSEFFQIIADEKITKIFHSSTQDLQIFYHQSRLVPKNVMDTQVMANFCGFDFNTGYSNLVEKLFQKKLDKKNQRSDWQARPLRKSQIEYAFLDVFFLIKIYEEFLKILESKNRAEWFFEEMEYFISKTLTSSTENLKRRFSFRDRSAKEISKIKDLILWRESCAQRIDVPRQHLLKDELIEKIAISQNFDFKFSSNITKEMISEMKKIIDHEVESFEKEKRFFMSEKQKIFYKDAKKLINKISVKENFKDQFLITSLDLKKAVCEEKFFNEKIAGWRYQFFGKELEQLSHSINL